MTLNHHPETPTPLTYQEKTRLLVDETDELKTDVQRIDTKLVLFERLDVSALDDLRLQLRQLQEKIKRLFEQVNNHRVSPGSKTGDEADQLYVVADILDPQVEGNISTRVWILQVQLEVLAGALDRGLTLTPEIMRGVEVTMQLIQQKSGGSSQLSGVLTEKDQVVSAGPDVNKDTQPGAPSDLGNEDPFAVGGLGYTLRELWKNRADIKETLKEIAVESAIIIRLRLKVMNSLRSIYSKEDPQTQLKREVLDKLFIEVPLHPSPEELVLLLTVLNLAEQLNIITLTPEAKQQQNPSEVAFVRANYPQNLQSTFRLNLWIRLNQERLKQLAIIEKFNYLEEKKLANEPPIDDQSLDKDAQESLKPLADLGNQSLPPAEPVPTPATSPVTPDLTRPPVVASTLEVTPPSNDSPGTPAVVPTSEATPPTSDIPEAPAEGSELYNHTMERLKRMVGEFNSTDFTTAEKSSDHAGLMTRAELLLLLEQNKDKIGSYLARLEGKLSGIIQALLIEEAQGTLREEFRTLLEELRK